MSAVMPGSPAYAESDGGTVALEQIRECLEGAIPAVMATCAADGTPNVAYLSQVFYVDERHVALSYQFFNKTRHNILANPQATLLVLDPLTARFYRLYLRYLRTETAGPLFEGMKAQLAGIASHSGMADVFRLLGSDVYRVQRVEALAGPALAPPPPRVGLLGAVRRASERMARCQSFDELLAAALGSLSDHAGLRHAMVLMLDEATQRLYTVASCGYATSGIGFEVAVGDGVIGVAAREATPVRISHMTHAALYSHAVRSRVLVQQPGVALETDIPFPGLAAPHSQLAVPVVSANRVLGVLFVESPCDRTFGFEDEDMLVAVAGHLGAAIERQRVGAVVPATVEGGADDPMPQPLAPSVVPQPTGTLDDLPLNAGPELLLRHFPVNNSVFLGDTYLIKGVAGAVLWRLLTIYQATGRTEFTNRELRLDPTIGLPDVADNLEARLVLLQRRLAENSPHVQWGKAGRGRLRLVVKRPLRLQSGG